MKEISKSEIRFLDEASKQFDRYPHISCYRSPEFVAFRGYTDEVEVYRFDKHHPKVATFTGQIKQVKQEEK